LIADNKQKQFWNVLETHNDSVWTVYIYCWLLVVTPADGIYWSNFQYLLLLFTICLWALFM